MLKQNFLEFNTFFMTALWVVIFLHFLNEYYKSILIIYLPPHTSYSANTRKQPTYLLSYLHLSMFVLYNKMEFIYCLPSSHCSGGNLLFRHSYYYLKRNRLDFFAKQKIAKNFVISRDFQVQDNTQYHV